MQTIVQKTTSKTIIGLLTIALASASFISCDNTVKDTPIPKPTLIGINPDAGTWNDIVTISGNNFGINAKIVNVKFQDSVAIVRRVTNTEIDVIVPEEAGTGPLTITIGDNVLISPVFTYEPFIVSGPQVSTMAGSSIGYKDDVGENAKFNNPHTLAVDAEGNVFVADAGNQVIRKVTPEGEVTTFAGSGEKGFADGPGATAKFDGPYGIAVDAIGNVYVADLFNSKIRKISPTGDVITLAGSGLPGSQDGPGATAQFNWPIGVAVDSIGNVWVVDRKNHNIRKITPEGYVTTVAGSSAGYADGTGSEAKFNVPHGITIDGEGILYIADKENNMIRKVTKDGVVTTLAGNGDAGYEDGSGSAAKFNLPRALGAAADGTVYVGDTDNNRIRMITPDGAVTTIAGSIKGWEDGPGEDAKFSGPRGISVGIDGAVYIADNLNHRIRKIVIVE